MTSDSLIYATLLALHELPPQQSMSLPRLCKRLGYSASTVMRQLALMGETAVGETPGLGWVQVCVHQDRQLVQLTPQGYAYAEEWLASVKINSKLPIK